VCIREIRREISLELNDVRERRYRIFKCIDFLEAQLRELLLTKPYKEYGDKWLERIPDDTKRALLKTSMEFEDQDSYYPDLKDYALIIDANWEYISSYFKGLNRERVIKILRRLRKKRRLSHHASPRVFEKDVKETETLVRKLLMSDEKKKNLTRLLEVKNLRTLK
jgi:DNA-binding transcriptional ArsR family regulator